ncbi:zinc finger protein 711-like isoform X1 [Haemaphysalis longicornis]
MLFGSACHKEEFDDWFPFFTISVILGDRWDQGETFPCQTQGPVLSREFHDQHVQDEHSEKAPGKFQCSYCPYSTDHCTTIVRHERTHTGERPFVCDLCRKGFVGVGQLRRHQRTVHDKKKPHECGVCGLRFGEASNLVQHCRNKHMQGTPSFVCPQCGKGFPFKHVLVRHLRTHTGERPYVCATCGKTFAYLFEMKKHKMVVHDGKHPHYCPHCRKGLDSVRDLKTHLCTHHTEGGEGESALGENDE